MSINLNVKLKTSNMKRMTSNKKMLIALCMLSAVVKPSTAQTVWDFTDANTWGNITLTSGSYDATGSTSGKNSKITFNFTEGNVSYDKGIKISANGSTATENLQPNMPGNGYVSALVKIEGNEATANLAYKYGSGTYTASKTGTHICISNPKNNAKAGTGCWVYATGLGDGSNITIEKIARHSIADETSVEIGSTGIATLYPATVVKFADPSDIKVYLIKEVKNGFANLVEVASDQPLAGFQGYIIKGAEGTYALSVQRDAAELDDANMLKGSIAATTINSDANTNRYFLASDAKGNISFKKIASDTESAARKAWLEIPASQESGQYLSIAFPNGGTTGINSASVKAESNKDGVCYDLNGVAKKAPSKGINIRNGKKFVIK